MKTDIDLWVAPHTIRWYETGEHCSDPKIGDIIIVRHRTFLATIIAFAQWLLSLIHHEFKGYTWGDHVAVIIQASGQEFARNTVVTFAPGTWIVSEMGPRGHEHRALSAYQSKLYCVVHFDVPAVDHQKVVNADYAFNDIDYGFIQYPFLAINAFTGLPISVSFGSSMVCSCEVTIIGMNIYWIPNVQPSGVFPMHISYWVGASRK